MENKDTAGTVMSKLKPVVTMLTETLVKDFCPAYKPVDGGLWERTDDEYHRTIVDDTQLKADVEAWLLDLERRMENESDREYAKIVTHMIRQNKGWIILLTNRVKQRLNAG